MDEEHRRTVERQDSGDSPEPEPQEEVRLIEALGDYIEPPPMDKPASLRPELIGKTVTFGLYMTGPYSESLGQEALRDTEGSPFTRLRRHRRWWLDLLGRLRKTISAARTLQGDPKSERSPGLRLAKRKQNTEQFFYTLEPMVSKEPIDDDAAVGYFLIETFADQEESPDFIIRDFHKRLRTIAHEDRFPYLSRYLEQAPETTGPFSSRHLCDLFFGVPNILHAGSFPQADGNRRVSFCSVGFRLAVEKSSLAGNVRGLDEKEARRKVMAVMMDTAMTYRNFREALQEADLMIPEKWSQEEVRLLEEFLVWVEDVSLLAAREPEIDLWLKNHDMETVRSLLLKMALGFKAVLFQETKKLYAALASSNPARQAAVIPDSTAELGNDLLLDAVQRSAHHPPRRFSDIEISRDSIPPSVTILNWAPSPNPADQLGRALMKARDILPPPQDSLSLGGIRIVDAASCLPEIAAICKKDWPVLGHDKAIRLISGITGLHLPAIGRQPSVILNVYPGSQGDRFAWVDFINNLGLICESYWISVQGVSQDTVRRITTPAVLKNFLYSMLLPLCRFSAVAPVGFPSGQVHDIICLSQVSPSPSSLYVRGRYTFRDTIQGFPHILARIFAVKTGPSKHEGRSQLTLVQDEPIHYIKDSVSSAMNRSLAKRRSAPGVSIVILDPGLWKARHMVYNDIVEKLYINPKERKVIMGTVFDSRIIQFKSTGLLKGGSNRDGFELLSPESSVLRLVRERTGLEVTFGIFAPDPPAMVDKSRENVLHRHGFIFAFQSAQAVVDEAELTRTLLEFFTLRLTESFLYGYTVRKDRMFLSRSKCVPVYRDKGTCLRVSPEGLAFEEIREAMNPAQNGGCPNASA